MRKSRRKNITHYLAVAWVAVVSVGLVALFSALILAMATQGQYL